MKRKKMENSMRLEQMLMDLDIIDHDFFVNKSNCFSRRISSLENFSGGFHKWSSHMLCMLQSTEKNSKVDHLIHDIL